MVDFCLLAHLQRVIAIQPQVPTVLKTSILPEQPPIQAMLSVFHFCMSSTKSSVSTPPPPSAGYEKLGVLGIPGGWAATEHLIQRVLVFVAEIPVQVYLPHKHTSNVISKILCHQRHHLRTSPFSIWPAAANEDQYPHLLRKCMLLS